jgi:hypothetical protein
VKLYHGTTAAIATAALRDGLLPRRASGNPGHWCHSVSSSPDRVYLTRAYAAYFAMAASEKLMDHWGIVEIDTRMLDDALLVPDEDWVEQASRGQTLGGMFSELDAISDMVKRTAWIRDHMGLFGHLWDQSVKMLGNAAFEGEIEPAAITRVAIFEPDSNPMIVQAALDPSISILNYQIIGSKYRALTDWLMGEHVTAEQWLGEFSRLHLLDGSWEEMAAKINEHLCKRSGLSIIDNRRDENDA